VAGVPEVPGHGGVAVSPRYQCSECGRQETRYYPQCVKCQKWNTLAIAEAGGGSGPALELTTPTMAPTAQQTIPLRPVARPQATPPPIPAAARAQLEPIPLSAARLAQMTARRVATGIPEFDRVLGGGIVDGSVILIGADPGVGKSTLAMQVMHALAHTRDVLYASGEENVQQIGLRADRLGIENPHVGVLAEADVDRIIETAARTQVALLVIDSIQKMRTNTLDSTNASLAQVSESTARLASFAKTTGTPVIMIGQVTKDGAIAGPKSMEHDVDVVLYFEQGSGARRLLTSPKNRHGSTDEVGVFEMGERGLSCVEDDRGALTERAAGVPGSAVFPAVHGERVQLVEIQALVGPPKHDERPKGSISVSGVDAKRVQMIAAILAKHAGIDIAERDVFVSVTAGARVADPAADLPIALAIASSYRDLPIDPSACCFGELGLAGELRSVGYAHARAREAQSGGFSVVLVARADASAPGAAPAQAISDAIALAIGEAVAVAS
jgi:DNA repair protein RadA/Sms